MDKKIKYSVIVMLMMPLFVMGMIEVGDFERLPEKDKSIALLALQMKEVCQSQEFWRDQRGHVEQILCIICETFGDSRDLTNPGNRRMHDKLTDLRGRMFDANTREQAKQSILDFYALPIDETDRMGDDFPILSTMCFGMVCSVFSEQLETIGKKGEFDALMRILKNHISETHSEPELGDVTLFTKNLQDIVDIIEQTNVPKSIKFSGHSVLDMLSKVCGSIKVLRDRVLNAPNKEEAVAALEAFSLSMIQLTIENDFPKQPQSAIQQICEMIKTGQIPW